MKKKKHINSKRRKKIVCVDDDFFVAQKAMDSDNVSNEPVLMKKKPNYQNKKKELKLDEVVLENKHSINKTKQNNNVKKRKNKKDGLDNKKDLVSEKKPNYQNKKKELKLDEVVFENKHSINKTKQNNGVNKRKNKNAVVNNIECQVNEKNASNVSSSKKSCFRRKSIIILLVFILLIIAIIYLGYNYHVNKVKEKQRLEDEQLVSNITSHFNKYVVVNKDAIIYSYDNNSDEYLEIGMIYQGVHLSLEELEITKNTKYFYIPYLDCYIEYKNVLPVEELQVTDNRYKNYIPFNKNVVTDNDFTLYSGDNKLYTFKKSMSFPIIINDYDNKYYIEFDNEMLYLLKDDVENIVDSENTKLKNTPSISVLNYHFIYDSNKKCNQSICLSAKRFEEHLKYIKSQNIFTPTMNEFELYLDKKIQLPKSVLLTFDDGWLRQTAIKILDEYEINATYFLVTSWYLPIESKYVEYHSHTHNMHNQGDCPTGQGGGIQCLSEKKIQADLAKSRSILNNTTVFCYPFYEYNNYSISQLKKAGFTMAFIGGNRKAYPGVNKYKIPRYVIYNTTTVDKLKKMI